MDETPAKICGGSVFDTGGRDQVLLRGAGVESVLHTARMFAITQPGASGTGLVGRDVEPLGRVGFAVVVFRTIDGGEGADVRLGDPSAVLFTGAVLLGVSWRALGVVVFGGVRADLGVDAPDAAREGVNSPAAERFVSDMLLVNERSRRANSFL